MKQTLTKIPVARVLVVLASLMALAFAFTMQYGLGLAPCHLCLWQRVPYAVIVALGLFACALRRESEERKAALLPLMVLALAVEVGLAFYHTGVEFHWWAGLKGCTAQPFDGTAASLLATPVVSCDEPAWKLGLSMAGWNAIYSLLLTLYAGYVLILNRPPKAPRA